MNEFDEFNKLLTEVNMESLSVLDQIKIAEAYAEMMTKVKPILLKALATQETSSTFLFRM